jgi:hypothetical protein
MEVARMPYRMLTTAHTCCALLVSVLAGLDARAAGERLLPGLSESAWSEWAVLAYRLGVFELIGCEH